MTIGPVERFMLRVQQLEAALGVRPAGLPRQRGRREAKLGPGGKKLLGMLRRRELDKAEEDALGEALLAEQRGDYRRAQEWLDMLAYGHRLRMAAERASSGKLDPTKVAGTGSQDGAKD